MSKMRFSWPPNAILPLKGRLDAHKGPAAACAYVNKTCQHLAVLTAQETIATEKALKKTRQDASGRLAERNRTLERLAVLSPVREENSAAAIRANRRDAEERACLRAALTGCEAAILSANETLINTQALLEERLAHLQAMTQERISLYVMGVRSSRGLKDFTIPCMEGTLALDTRSAEHQMLDGEIRRVAEELIIRKEAA